MRQYSRDSQHGGRNSVITSFEGEYHHVAHVCRRPVRPEKTGRGSAARAHNACAQPFACVQVAKCSGEIRTDKLICADFFASGDEYLRKISPPGLIRQIYPRTSGKRSEVLIRQISTSQLFLCHGTFNYNSFAPVSVKTLISKNGAFSKILSYHDVSQGIPEALK